MDSAQAQGGATTLEGLLAAEKLDATGELADVITAIEKRHGGTFHRTTVDKDGAKVVRVQFERENGDRIAAEGATTIEAAGKLRTRLETIDNAGQ